MSPISGQPVPESIDIGLKRYEVSHNHFISLMRGTQHKSFADFSAQLMQLSSKGDL